MNRLRQVSLFFVCVCFLFLSPVQTIYAAKEIPKVISDVLEPKTNERQSNSSEEISTENHSYTPDPMPSINDANQSIAQLYSNLFNIVVKLSMIVLGLLVIVRILGPMWRLAVSGSEESGRTNQSEPNHTQSIRSLGEQINEIRESESQTTSTTTVATTRVKEAEKTTASNEREMNEFRVIREHLHQEDEGPLLLEDDAVGRVIHSE